MVIIIYGYGKKYKSFWAFLFPEGAAVNTDVDIFKVSDSLSGEVAEHAVGVFGCDGRAAVNDSFDEAGVTVEVEIDLADGVWPDDGF